jgi:hypothetical protein
MKGKRGARNSERGTIQKFGVRNTKREVIQNEEKSGARNSDAELARMRGIESLECALRAPRSAFLYRSIRPSSTRPL